MRIPVLVCCLGLLVAIATPAQAQWKWKDARGQVHVSDIPPPREVQDKDILQRPSPAQRRASPAASAPAASAPAARPTVDPEIEARRKRAEAEQQAKAAAENDKIASLRAENCQRARRHLASLETGQRLARTNDKGEREVLDDKARAEEVAHARRAIDADCR